MAALVTVLCAVGFAQTGESKVYVVVIDPGHGHPDGGATGINTGACEADINLAISEKLKALFESSDFAVVMTRTGKDCLYSGDGNFKKGDMKMRRDVILRAKPDLVISVHLNKFSQSYRKGAQAFFKAADPQGRALAEGVQKVLNTNLNDRELSPLSGDYYMLNCSNFPSVIVECGFLSNPEEEARLLTDEYRETVAYCIYAGAINYLYSDRASV